MFERHCEIVDGLPVFDPDKTPSPIEPQLVVPTFDGRGWNPKPVADEKKLNKLSEKFVKAVYDANWEKVNKLLRYEVDLDFKNEAGDTALLLAIGRRHRDLVNFLLGQGADVNESNDFGCTPLHLACFFNEEILVKKLLFIGANVHKITKSGANAIHYCAMSGNVKIAKKLVKRGIDFTCKATHDGDVSMTPEQVAMFGKHEEFQIFIAEKVFEQNDAIAKHMEELQKEAAEEAKKQAEEARTLVTKPNNSALKYGPFAKYAYNPSEFADEGDRHYRGHNQTSLDDFGYSFKPTSNPTTFKEPGKPERSFWRDGPEKKEEDVIPPLIRDYEYAEEPASFWDGTPDGPEESDIDEEPWTDDPIERDLLRKARNNRVRFLDVNGVVIKPEPLRCDNCFTENDKEDDFCSVCSFVLHGKCPACGCFDVAERTYCPNCDRCLFDDQEAPPLQFVEDFPPSQSFDAIEAGPVASISNQKKVTAVAPSTDRPDISRSKMDVKFNGWVCNACGAAQLHMYNVYCARCRYILADECPECSQKEVWGKNECGCCTVSLWDGGIPSLEADLSAPKIKCVVCYRDKCICDTSFDGRQDEVTMRSTTKKNYNTLDDELCPLCNMVVCICYQGKPKKKKTVNFVGKLKCVMCETLNAASNSHCKECGYSMTTGVEEKADDDLYSPWGKSYYTPSGQADVPSLIHQPVPRQNTVETFFQPQTCSICDAIDSTGSALFCTYCAHALGNRCPHCFYKPIDGKDECPNPKCGKSQWNYGN